MENYLELGYLGLFLAAFIAATIFPFSSEGVLSLLLIAGYNPMVLILIATAGNWFGGLTTFGLGWLGKWEYVEKKLKIPKQKIEEFSLKMHRWGALAGFFCWMPVIGDLLALSLGFLKCNVWLVSITMLLGKGLRYIVWMQLTYSLFM